MVNVPAEALQVTPSWRGSFWTLDVNLKVCESVRPPRIGESVTLKSPGIPKMVMVALAVTRESVTEVAVSVTVPGVGAAEGAVYVMGAPEELEEAERVPQAAPVQPEPESVQVTPWFCVSFWTVALNA